MIILRYAISAIFVFQMYLMMLIIGIVFLPWAIFDARGARTACRVYSWWTFWTARWMIGLRTEVRGNVPTGEVIIAAKHQSFLDIMMIFASAPAAKFIMKREILWTPIIGLYAYRFGCVPVDRGKRAQAIGKMVKDVKSGARQPGQLIIYSQGTRVAPGAKEPYKIGTFVLYRQLQQPCVPAATNVGLFWPRRGILRKPGLAVVEFLDPIAPGLEQKEFMTRLEDEVETRTDALMAEAGFDGIRH